MATITMPREFDGAIQTIIQQAREKAVEALAEKYGFDAEEAQAFLVEGGIKVVKMRGPVPKAKKAVKAKKAPKAEKPKRAQTGYLLFSSEERESTKLVLTAELEEDQKLAPQLVVKELAKRWKALGEDERSYYNQLAAADPRINKVAVEVLELRNLMAVRQPSEYRVGPRGCNHVGMCSCGA